MEAAYSEQRDDWEFWEAGTWWLCLKRWDCHESRGYRLQVALKSETGSSNEHAEVIQAQNYVKGKHLEAP